MSAPVVLWCFVAIIGLATTAGILILEKWGTTRLLDIPNPRSSHSTPTPRGAGLPLVVTVLVGWQGYLWLTGRLAPVHIVLTAAASVVAAVSWLDDLRPLRFSIRLVAHSVAALLLLVAAPPPHEVLLPGLGLVPLWFGAWPLSVLWIVGLTNAYNFMDGIDGLAGGQGVVAGCAWAVIGFGSGAPAVGALGLFIAAACAVFLFFNWAPARIFLGDVGSATLGFLFAALPLVRAYEAPGLASAAWVAGAAAAWPFIFDAGFTLIRRWRRGETLTQAHRSHLYQRLVIAGWSHGQVSTLYILWAVTTSVAGWAMVRGSSWSGAIGLAWAVWSGVMVWRLVVAVEHP